MGADWSDVLRELDLWAKAGQIARLWLRDDDAISTTPALDRLMELSAKHHTPILLGVIPMLARPCLVQRLAGCPHITVAMHGIWHQNHAMAGQKKQELPPELGRHAILERLRLGRSRLVGLFGEPAGAWYIPPWNRIAPEAAALLPEVGFTALSCFAAAASGIPALAQRNTHVDLMNWQAGRTGKPPSQVAAELARELARARTEGFRPVGVLAHHLDHDENAWRSLASLLEITSAHANATWVTSGDLMD
jgi:hypothetical protein